MNTLPTDICSRLLTLLLATPFVFVAYKTSKVECTKLLFLVSGLFLLDRIWFSIPNIIITNSNLTWQGKIISTIWSLTFIFLFSNLSAKEFGITNKFRTGTFNRFLRFEIILIISLISTLLFLHKHQEFTKADLLYQATMPGISEEFLYRGILLTLLNKVFITKWQFLKTKIGWGFIIVTFIFALVHSLTIENFNTLKLSFDLSSFLWMLIPSFIFGYVKEWTGNLFASVITHNVWNIVTVIGKAF